MNRPAFWVLYDYGQGGLWAILHADSAGQVRARYPQLQVFDGPPPSLDAAAVESIRRQGARDIDDPPSGWLAELPPPDAGGGQPSAG